MKWLGYKTSRRSSDGEVRFWIVWILGERKQLTKQSPCGGAWQPLRSVWITIVKPGWMDVYAASQPVTIFSKPTYLSRSSSYIPLEYSLEDSLHKTRFHLVNKVKKKIIIIQYKRETQTVQYSAWKQVPIIFAIASGLQISFMGNGNAALTG